jgi:hypothetical protein
MAKGPVPINPAASQATRDRDLVIRTVRDELLAFMGQKLAKERKREIKSLGPDVACMIEALAEAMALLHVDVIRSMSHGDVGLYERKIELARERERSQ